MAQVRSETDRDWDHKVINMCLVDREVSRDTSADDSLLISYSFVPAESARLGIVDKSWSEESRLCEMLNFCSLHTDSDKRIRFKSIASNSWVASTHPFLFKRSNQRS